MRSFIWINGFFSVSLPARRRTQRFPVSVPSLWCSESLFFLRLEKDKIGAEFLLDFDCLDIDLSTAVVVSSSSSSEDDDCRWRLNVFEFEIFSLRLRRRRLFNPRRDDDDDVRLLWSSCSSFISESASIRRLLLLLIERVSSALDLAWRVVVVVVVVGSSSINDKNKTYQEEKKTFFLPSIFDSFVVDLRSALKEKENAIE